MTQNFVQSHNDDIGMLDAPKVLIVDGPRGTGKSSLIAELGKISKLYVPIKFRDFMNFESVTHPVASMIRMDYLARYIAQLSFDPHDPIPVMDRFVGTEIVMSRITKRANIFEIEKMWELDDLWSRFAIQVILRCNDDVRLQRAGDRKSEGTPETLNEFWGAYAYRTRIKTLQLDTTSLSTQEAAHITHDFATTIRSQWSYNLQYPLPADPGVILGDAPMP